MSDEKLTRPIIGIENRTALEVFDIMCDRIRRLSPKGHSEASVDIESNALIVRLKKHAALYRNGAPLLNEVAAALEAQASELKAVEHDFDRLADRENHYLNQAEELRRILAVARPYISDKAGAGIIGAVDTALSGVTS
jgi:hypothetical protein